jgi:hypothetical protein
MAPRDPPPRRETETGAPPANFTITTAERLRAAAGGPPAYMRRLREIEDLTVAIARALGDRRVQAISMGKDPEVFARSNAPRRAIARLEELVARHNRFYPIEANLPIDPRTGALRDRHGEVWRPLPCPSLDDLLRMSAAVGAGVRSASMPCAADGD